MKAHMSHAMDADLEEEDGPHCMEDAVNQIRLQRQRQREQKVEQEKMEEMECDQFLGDHGIDIADLSVQEKRDIRRALQISTQDMPGPSHTFTRSPSPQPSTSGFSSHAFRRNPSPVQRSSWNDSASDDDFSENRPESRTPQSRVVRPVPQRKRPSPEGDEGTGAKAVRLKSSFYGSSSQTQALPQRGRRSVQETPPVKPLLQRPRPRLLDPERPVQKEEAATKASSSACDATVIEDDAGDDVSILSDTRRPKLMRRRLALPDDGAVKRETVTSGSTVGHQSAKKPPRMLTPEEEKIVEQFMEELSWKPDCRKLKRKYRAPRKNTGSDEYQSLLKGSVFTKLFIDFWNSYFCKLHQEQSRACRQLQWGAPVLPGRHHSQTLDRKLRGEESFTWNDREEEEAADAQATETQAPETDVWKPAKVRLSRSGKGGGGVKVRPAVEGNEETGDVIVAARRDPIPLPAPSRVPVLVQGFGLDGKKPSMDYDDFLCECDAPASPPRAGGGVGGVDNPMQPSQSSTSDSILNSQGDIYSTQFPRRRNRAVHTLEDSGDLENLLPRLSKRNRVESHQRTATATMSCSDSVLPSRKRSRMQETVSAGSQKVQSPVDLDMDCIAVETDARAEPDVFALDDNEDAEKEDFINFMTKLKEVRTYSRRRPVATVSFAKTVDEENEPKNLFTPSSGSCSSQPSGSQVQQEDSEDEVQLLSSSSEGQEEMAAVKKAKGRIPRRRILQPLMEEDTDARDLQGKDHGTAGQEEDNCEGCTLIACPMCQREFPDTEIEVHAAYCNGPEPEPERIVTRRIRATASHTQNAETEQDHAHNRESWMDREPVACLICDRQFPDNGSAFKKHLSQCEARAAARARQLEGMEAMVVDDGTNSNPPSTRSRAGAACQ